ncbi:MAG: ATP-dependent DNA helicase [Candidatus Micrarchaeota archaeon]|nr:ATP-dependent DNA helicase [Candidatus Micrarchaeota archaeon]
MFPYVPRRFQKEVMELLKKHAGQNICLQAPTGFGKTPVILSALLETSDRKILWCVRTGNEASRPIEELRKISEKHHVFGFSFRGKKDMCLLLHASRIEKTHSNAVFLCARKKKTCRYFSGLSSGIFDFYTPVNHTEIYKFCRDNGLCPYYMQKRLFEKSRVVSLSYNYVLNTEISKSLSQIMDLSECILVVDEAHNLRNAWISANSDRITKTTFERAAREAENLGETGISREILSFFNTFARFPEGESVLDVSSLPSRDLFEEVLVLGDELRTSLLEQGKNPSSSLHRLGEFFLKVIDSAGPGTSVTVEKNNDLKIEFTDMRTEKMQELWEKFSFCIFCSGTLKPIKAFSEPIGLKNYRYIEVPSIFDPEKIECVLVKGVSTRGESLEEEMKKRYAALIEYVLSIGVNTALFFSSYRIMNELSVFVDRKNAFFETPGMSAHEAEKMLEEFKKKGGVLCASLHGRFSEGIDLPGSQLECVAVIGVPFEKPDLKTRILLDYYRKRYGSRGRFYGYIVPAMIKVSQALGRALRSEDDKAVFILADERYGNPGLMKLLPDYVRNVKIAKVEELVKK